ncbi:NAD(P)/FAD-dependent oxidoreductase [Amnibacterium sp. CER49]|uniref:flavin-containing monooxygenase n=1 Tax=Amnibacterium sp. CER49 TaxID=3039161 RepID=UPI00244A7BF3|nr:NAD(P)/FAD-dependent oxidoreductase [Amnibacterium sp. CER49]MDH2444504.1 NAD(P)/FAD-dependent oxidoreductase [Amnibacterium sp. CER49]
MQGRTRASAGPVVVVGAGPAGLAAAAQLRRRGVDALVLEAGTAVGSSWRSAYDRLALHTVRSLSGLPGLRIPREAGRWVASGELVRYLERYTTRFALHVRADTRAARIDAAPSGTGTRWTVTTEDAEVLRARTVAVATGRNGVPFLPPWPGADDYRGSLLHAAQYRNGEPFRGLDVLVVGPGNTGTDIAVDLAEHGAARVRLAVRTPPHLVRRQTGPLPAQIVGLAAGRLPDPVVDLLGAVQIRLTVPDLGTYGLPRARDGLGTRLRLDGAIPTQDVGIVAAIRSGAVEPVPGVTAFEDDEVRLADGRRISPSVVIAATGYRPGLEPLVGHLGVLTPTGLPRIRGGRAAAPGLAFLGYTVSLGGVLHEIGTEARRFAAEVAADR